MVVPDRHNVLACDALPRVEFPFGSKHRRCPQRGLTLWRACKNLGQKARPERARPLWGPRLDKFSSADERTRRQFRKFNDYSGCTDQQSSNENTQGSLKTASSSLANTTKGDNKQLSKSRTAEAVTWASDGAQQFRDSQDHQQGGPTWIVVPRPTPDSV